MKIHKLILLIMASFFAIAQNALDDVDELLDITDEAEKEKKIEFKKDSLDEIIGGKFTSSYTTADTTNRHNEALTFYWQRKVNEVFSFRTELRFINSQIENTLEIETTRRVTRTETVDHVWRDENGEILRIDRGIQETRTVTERETEDQNSKLSVFEVEPRDVYFKLKQGNWSATIGYQTYTLGVGTLSSPLDFVLVPDRSDSTPINLNRLDGKLAQPIINLNYQKGSWDFTYLFHPIFVLDKFVEARFERAEDGFPGGIVDKDEQRHLVRFIYRGDNFLMGFTYYKGLNPRFFTDIYDMQLSSNSNNTYLFEANNQTITRTNSDIEAIARQFDDLEVFAWEFAYNSNKWRYAFEGVYVKGFADTLPQQPLNPPNTGTSLNQLSTYNQFIADNYDGILADIDGHTITLNLGFDYTGKRHIVNFYLTAVLPQLSDKAQKAKELWEAENVNNSEQSLGENIIFVTFNWSYFLDKQKEDIIGFAIGNFTSSIGGGLYYKKKVNDNLSYALTVGVVQYNIDQQFETEDPNEKSELKNDMPAIANFSLQYTF